MYTKVLHLPRSRVLASLCSTTDSQMGMGQVTCHRYPYLKYIIMPLRKSKYYNVNNVISSEVTGKDEVYYL